MGRNRHGSAFAPAGAAAPAIAAVAVAIAASALIGFFVSRREQAAGQAQPAQGKRRRRCRQRSVRSADVLAAQQQRDESADCTITDVHWEAITAEARKSGNAANEVEAAHSQQLQAQLVKITLPCTPAQLLLHLCHPESKFHKDKAQRLSLSNFEASEWASAVGGGKIPWQRTATYDMPLSSRLGPSHAHNIETQTLQDVSKQHWKMAIDAKQPNVPLGNTFRTHILYSAIQTSSKSTELLISGELHFKKQGVSLLRGAIESGWRKGTHKTYKTVEDMLKEAFVAGGAADDTICAVAAGAQPESQQVVAKDTRQWQLQRYQRFAPGSLALLLLFCVLALLLQLPFLPVAQVQVYQHLVAAKLLQLFNGHV